MSVPFSLCVPNPDLRAALDRAATALGIPLDLRCHQPEHGIAPGKGTPAPFTSPQGPVPVVESDRPLRLGALLDWVVVRAQKSVERGQIPDVLSLKTGSLDLRARLFTPTDGRAAVRLTDREVEIFCALYQAPGHTLSKAGLLADVWGYAPTTETHTIETHVYRLRQKTEPDPGHPQIVVTTENGYRMVTGSYSALR